MNRKEGGRGREPSAGARKKTSGNGGKEGVIFGVFRGKKRKKEG